MMRRIALGEYIVADPKICHGRPTFKGTRIFVADVLEQIAEGRDWDEIIEEWRGRIPKGAIAEAIRLAGKALEHHMKIAQKSGPGGRVSRATV